MQPRFGNPGAYSATFWERSRAQVACPAGTPFVSIPGGWKNAGWMNGSLHEWAVCKAGFL